ncbi:Uma2 family endonuclease [soil metagenome]
MVADRPRVKKWTLKEVERLLTLGGGDSFDGYELLEGDLLEKMPQNDPHWYGQVNAVDALRQAFGTERHYPAQQPIKFNQADAPEPDVAVLTRLTPRPKPGETLIIVEVADSSVADNLQRKARIYARHAVPDYWVVDVVRKRLVVHRQPHPETEDWGQVFEVLPGESVAPLGAPEHPIAVADLLRQGEV